MSISSKYIIMSISAEHLKLIQNGLDVNCLKSATLQVEDDNGNNFMGQIKKICIQEETGTEHRLILKIAPKDPTVRAAKPIVLAFNREYEIYSKILPELTKFQDLHQISAPFTGFARFYGGSAQELEENILMQDLSFYGFKCHNEYDAMDFSHMTIMFEEYAKLHAFSLALRYKDPAKFEELTRNIKLNIFEIFKVETPEFLQVLTPVFLEMGKRAVEGNKKAEIAQRKFAEVLPKLFEKNEDNPEEEILVVSHGDCHPNNMLFLYEGNEKVNTSPQKICFIDWQDSSKETPIHDLSFALSTCASKEALSRAEELFKIYHDKLSENLKEFGCDHQKIFSYKDFQDHWKKYFLYGLFRGQMTLKLMLMTADQKIEAAKFSTLLEILEKDSLSSSAFVQRMQDLFEVFGEKWL